MGRPSSTPFLQMPVFYLRAALAFFCLRAVGVCLHYLGPSPWGGPLVLRPDRFLPEALTIEAGIWGLFFSLVSLPERSASLRPKRASYRALVLALGTLLAIFSQIDFEVVRWLGQHMSISYIRNFAGARDGKLFTRILSGDVLFSSLAFVQMAAAVGLGIFLWTRTRHREDVLRQKTVLAFSGVTVVALASPFWLRPSEKRWRRIEPASIGVIREAYAAAWGADSPHNPRRAHADLVSLVYHGTYDSEQKPTDPRYPLYRDDNVGARTVREFRALPLAEKPDVIVIVFETMRGMNTGFLGDEAGAIAAMPRLRGILEHKARYFPRMHSAGYPSVGGAMGMHLGVWPHHTRIVFSTYLHIGTRAFPEMLRQAGYESHALLGADPSFSNFTPWFRRWYDEVEYDPQNHHDGPLVDRFLELYEAKKSSPQPLLLTLWTATTHPPYDVPPESGMTPAGTNEERYLQAMRYADTHIARLLEHLRTSPRYERTLVFVLGDHSQPTPYQWTHTDELGELNPGHTWTALGILGGEKVAPTPGRDDRAISHIDLGPTILGAIDLKVKNHFFGRNLLADEKERPVWAFRYGSISREDGNLRTIFRVDDSSTKAYRFDRDDLKSYGALEGGTRSSVPAPSSDSLERHRDVARAWAELLDEDRVAPAIVHAEVDESPRR